MHISLGYSCKEPPFYPSASPNLSSQSSPHTPSRVSAKVLPVNFLCKMFAIEMGLEQLIPHCHPFSLSSLYSLQAVSFPLHRSQADSLFSYVSTCYTHYTCVHKYMYVHAYIIHTQDRHTYTRHHAEFILQLVCVLVQTRQRCTEQPLQGLVLGRGYLSLPAVTRCLCLGVNLQMSLLPHQYAHCYRCSPGLSMCISKRDCFPADSLVLWATHFPSLSKKEILAFQLPCRLLSLESVVIAFCLRPFSLSFIFNILFQVTSNSNFIHQSFSAVRAMMGCSYLLTPSQPSKTAFCTLVHNLVSALFSLQISGSLEMQTILCVSLFHGPTVSCI